MTKKIFNTISFMTYFSFLISALFIAITSCAAPYEPEPSLSSEENAEVSSVNFSYAWDYSSQEFMSGGTIGNPGSSGSSYALPPSSQSLEVSSSSSTVSTLKSFEPGESYAPITSYDPGISNNPTESYEPKESSSSSVSFLYSYNPEIDYPPYSNGGSNPGGQNESSNDNGTPMSGTVSPNVNSIIDAIQNFKSKNEVTSELWFALVNDDQEEAENIFNYLMSKKENAAAIHEIQNQIINDRDLISDIGMRWAEDPNNYDINETLIAQGITDPVDQYIISQYISSFFAP